MRPRNDEALTPSMLDRLIDPESGGTAAAPGYRVDQMFDVVRRDLEDLLNTRQTNTDLPRDYTELHNSVFSFGVPDLTSLNAVDVQDRENIARMIELIINRHEPRLRDVKVRLVHVDGQHLERKVRYRVEARLNLDPAPEVAFDTILELSTGQYAVQTSGA